MKKTLFSLTIIMLIASISYSDYIEIGTGTYHTANIPFYGYRDYGWSRVIYLHSEIGAAIDITKISYCLSNTVENYETNNQKIYMKDTTDTIFFSNDYEDTSTYQEVYNGTINWDGSGWFDIILDTPFNYNGSDNLVIYYQNHDGDRAIAWPMWDRTDTDQDNRGLYNYANDTFPSNAGTLEDYYVNIRLHYTTTGTPGEPTNPNPSHNAMGIPATGYVTWDFGINTDTYDLLFGPAGSMIEVVSGADAGTSGMYAYTDLNSGSEYNWQVIAHNSSKLSTNGPIWAIL